MLIIVIYMQDFDLYFSKKYNTFQLFDFASSIYVYLYNNENNTSKSELLMSYQVQNLEEMKIENLPSKTIDELSKTNSIIIKKGSSKLGKITNNVIEQILNYISMSKQYEENLWTSI